MPILVDIKNIHIVIILDYLIKYLYENQDQPNQYKIMEMPINNDEEDASIKNALEYCY